MFPIATKGLTNEDILDTEAVAPYDLVQVAQFNVNVISLQKLKPIERKVWMRPLSTNNHENKFSFTNKLVSAAFEKRIQFFTKFNEL